MTSPGHKRYRNNSPMGGDAARHANSASSRSANPPTRRLNDAARRPFSYTAARTPPFAASLPPDRSPPTPTRRTSSAHGRSSCTVNSLTASTPSCSSSLRMGHTVSTPVQLAQSSHDPSSVEPGVALTALLLPPATPAPGGAAGHYAKHTLVIHDVLRRTSLAEMRDREVVDWLVETDRWLRRVVQGQHRSGDAVHHTTAYAHPHGPGGGGGGSAPSGHGGIGAELRFLVLDVLHTMPWWRLVEYSESSSAMALDKNGALHGAGAALTSRAGHKDDTYNNNSNNSNTSGANNTNCNNSGSNKDKHGSNRAAAAAAAAARSITRTHRRIQLALEQMCMTLVEQSQHTVPGVLDVMMKPFRLRPPVRDGARRVIPSDSLIRLLGTLAARYPSHYVMDWLQRCVAALVPKRRWAECRHHVACTNILLTLALDAYVPSVRLSAPVTDWATETAPVLRSLLAAWQVSETTDQPEKDSSNNYPYNDSTTMKSSTEEEMCHSSRTHRIHGSLDHGEGHNKKHALRIGGSFAPPFAAAAAAAASTPSSSVGGLLQPNKMTLYRSELLSFLLQWLLEMEITLDRADEDDDEDEDADRLTDDAVDDTASWSSSCGSCYSSSRDGSTRWYTSASMQTLRASFGPRGDVVESGRESTNRLPGSSGSSSFTTNVAKREPCDTAVTASLDSKNDTQQQQQQQQQQQHKKNNTYYSNDNHNAINNNTSKDKCDNHEASKLVHRVDATERASSGIVGGAVSALSESAVLPDSSTLHPSTRDTTQADTQTRNDVPATSQTVDDGDDAVARQFSPHARPFLHTLRVCTTLVFAQLATDARRQRQEGGGGGNGGALPEWWTDVLRFHLHAVMRIERPVCLLYLVPSLAMLGVHEESVDVLHKIISLVTKGYIAYGATAHGASAHGAPLASAMMMGGSSAAVSSGVLPYAFMQSAGRLLASGGGPAASAVRMRMPAAGNWGGGGQVQSVSLPQRLRAARLIFPMFRFMYARLSGAEGVYRRLLKWVAQATATAKVVPPLPASARRQERAGLGNSRGGSYGGASSASLVSLGSGSGSGSAAAAVERVVMMPKRVHAPPRLVRVLFAQCAAMADVLGVSMERVTAVRERTRSDSSPDPEPSRLRRSKEHHPRAVGVVVGGGEEEKRSAGGMRVSQGEARTGAVVASDDGSRSGGGGAVEEQSASCTAEGVGIAAEAEAVTATAAETVGESSNAEPPVRTAAAIRPHAVTQGKDWVRETLQPLIERYRVREMDATEAAEQEQDEQQEKEERAVTPNAGVGGRVVHTPVRLDLAQMQKEGLLRPTLMDGCVWRHVLETMLEAGGVSSTAATGSDACASS